MRLVLGFVAVMLTGSLASSLAHADAGTDTAKAHYKRGLGAFALGRFAEAAQEYEAAFAIEPDPALLYNAAQAHRQAGNKERALQLYKNYLRLFPNPPNRADVQRHIANLQKAIDTDRTAVTAPPSDPIKTNTPTTPVVTPPPVSKPEPAPVSRPEPAPTAVPVVTSAPPPAKSRPKWVWGVVGGGVGLVVVGVAVGLGIGLSGTRYPHADVEARLQ